MASPEILIVGAGPTGMVAALSFIRQGVPFRIIDASAGPGTQSRAMGVHARTLELYRTFGIDEQVIAHGIHSLDANIRTINPFTGRPMTVATMGFSRIGQGLSKYPYILQIPQDIHEKLLEPHLDGKIERSTVMTDLRDDAKGIHVTIIGPQGEERATYRYVLGCDGAHSKVRHAIDVGFSGGMYTQPFYVADVKLSGKPDDRFIITLDANTMALRSPVRTGQTRIVGIAPKHISHVTDLQFEDVKETAESLISAKIESVAWFSHYNVHHRVAEKYRIGNVFILGDAAHLHSPMGGQGMNTGIGDAYNLAWKIAHVMQGRIDEDVLSTYEIERHSFAEKLVKTTDTAFQIIIRDDFVGTLIRTLIWPLLMAIITSFEFARTRAFKFMSQIHISYATSSCSLGQNLGSIRPGDRVPWVQFDDGSDNYQSFDAVNWQLQVFQSTTSTLDLQELKWIQVQRYPLTQRARQAGLTDGCVLFVRPDTYIGLTMKRFDLEELRRYVRQLGLR